MADDVWEADPWLVVTRGDTVYCHQFPDQAERRRAARRLADGDTPDAVFGRFARRLRRAQVRSVEWVPAVRTVPVRRHWLRDPWRLTVADAADGERLFRGLSDWLPAVCEPTESRVGPHDLAMDPRLGLGVLLAVAGLIALVGGAVEGMRFGPLQGPGRRLVVIAELGDAIGLAGVIGVGAIAFAAGVGGLVWWYRNRQAKWVVRPA